MKIKIANGSGIISFTTETSDDLYLLGILSAKSIRSQVRTLRIINVGLTVKELEMETTELLKLLIQK